MIMISTNSGLNLRLAAVGHNPPCIRLGQDMAGARPEADNHLGEGTVQRLVVDIVRHPEDTHPGVDIVLVEVDIVLVEVDIVLVEEDTVLEGVDKDLVKIKYHNYK